MNHRLLEERERLNVWLPPAKLLYSLWDSFGMIKWQSAEVVVVFDITSVSPAVVYPV